MNSVELIDAEPEALCRQRGNGRFRPARRWEEEVVNRMSRRRRATAALVALALVGWFWIGRGAAEDRPSPAAPVESFLEKIAHFETLTDKERQAVVDGYLADRERVLKALAKLTDSRDPDTRFYAEYLLGAGRFDGAEGILNNRILDADEKRWHETHVHPWLWAHYPAMEAFSDVGPDSVPWLVNDLETRDEPKVRDLALEALREVEYDDEFTTILLKRAVAAHQHDPVKLARLQSALKALAAEKEPFKRDVP